MEQGKEDSSIYWIERFKTDSTQLSEQQRFDLTGAMLKCVCGLNPSEIESFMQATIPGPDDIEAALSHSSAAGKVVKYYNGTIMPNEGTPEYEDLKSRAEIFKESFGSILGDVYLPSQVSEIFSLAPTLEAEISNDEYITRLLVGSSHEPYRRIRNAYLPSITSLHREKDDGTFTDATHELFDGDQDPVDQIEGLLGTNN